jgi:hypothetical protein
MLILLNWMGGGWPPFGAKSGGGSDRANSEPLEE